jgi:hypothetical protein
VESGRQPSDHDIPHPFPFEGSQNGFGLERGEAHRCLLRLASSTGAFQEPFSARARNACHAVAALRRPPDAARSRHDGRLEPEREPQAPCVARGRCVESLAFDRAQRSQQLRTDHDLTLF